jgi:hypothetical protein
MLVTNPTDMNLRSASCLSPRRLAAVAIGAAFAISAPAEIVSIAGRVEATITERIVDGIGRSQTSTSVFPGNALPLQVLADLTTGQGSFPSAGAVAAQFADPNNVLLANPEEFAINLTLNSVAPDVSYDGVAVSEETRVVQFAAGELGVGSAEGDLASVRGRLFLDGALAIIAADSGRDLTGCTVKLALTITRSTEGQPDETAYFGSVALVGGGGGGVDVQSDGDFPTARLILSNLGRLSENFGALQVLIIPNIQIDYTYTAVVGTPATLTARVQVDAANSPDNVGVAAVLGTPIGTLSQVLTLTNGFDAASKTVDLIQRERSDPTGQAAFPQGASTPFGNCGLFGLEAMLGLVGLVGLKLRIRRT